MGTVIIINRSTLTDAAAVARVGLYLAGKKDLAEVDGIHIRQTAASGYGERRKFLVTEGHPADRAFKGRKPDE